MSFSAYPYHHPDNANISNDDTSNTPKPRRVHFVDDFTPSSLSLNLKLGPASRPTVVLKISVYFQHGRLPRIKVRTRKTRDGRKRREWERERR